MNKTAEQLLAEEKELEALTFGTPSETLPKDDETTTAETDGLTAPSKTDGMGVPEGKTAEPEGSLEEWKKRYTNLRASRDQRVLTLEASVATYKQTILELQDKVQGLEAGSKDEGDIWKDVLTAEDTDALGESAIDVIKKVTKRVTDQSRESTERELAEIRKSRIMEANEAAKLATKANYDTFLGRLQSLVPKYKEVDSDPAFIKYLKGEDIDGSIRFDSFVSAEQRGDVATVARFMQSFLEGSKKVDKLSDHIGPKGSPASTSKLESNTEEGGFITSAQVDAHYDKHARGGYKGREKEFLTMERKIDEAASAGKIRG